MVTCLVLCSGSVHISTAIHTSQRHDSDQTAVVGSGLHTTLNSCVAHLSGLSKQTGYWYCHEACALNTGAVFQGVENVYTQHTPLLLQTLEAVAKGRLKEGEYPSVDKAVLPSQPAKVQPPKLVVVFIVGGTTYEEARAVTELNAQSEKNEGWASGIKFVLGGTSVQNSTTFMHDLAEMTANEKMYST